MKLNPIIPQRKKLHDQLWDFVQPNSTNQIDLELENQEYIYYNECCYNLPIEAYTTPSLHLLCLSVKERLHVTDNVVFQVDNREFITGIVTDDSVNTAVHFISVQHPSQQILGAQNL